MPKSPLIILTREPTDNAALRALLAAEGAEVLEYPCIRTEPIPAAQWHLPADRSLESYPVVAFTSRHGVRAFVAARAGVRAGAQMAAVVGSSTAAEVLIRFGRRADLIASPPTADGLASRLLESLRPGTEILWVRGNRSTDNFREKMASHGFKVAELVVYRNLPVRLEPLPLRLPALVVFASPSAVENFFQTNGSKWKHCLCVAIGPATAESLVSLGCTRVEEAREPAPESMAGLIRSLLQEVN